MIMSMLFYSKLAINCQLQKIEEELVSFECDKSAELSLATCAEFFVLICSKLSILSLEIAHKTSKTCIYEESMMKRYNKSRDFPAFYFLR